MQVDGWKVQQISLLTNPNPKSSRPKRFWGVYTKLKIFSLIQYKKGKILYTVLVFTLFLEVLYVCCFLFASAINS
jgi:hypothetical protein